MYFFSYTKTILLTLSIFSLLLLIKCKPNNQSIRIATAANFQFPMEEIVQLFEQKFKYNCDVIISSSGKLAAQIVEGAPYHLFFSADSIYPNYVLNKGLGIKPARSYANGQLIFWSYYSDLDLNPAVLKQKQNLRIAIANPETAPYGKAAMQVLEKLDFNLDKIEIVYGESISQTNQFITTGAVDFGLSSASSIHSTRLKDMKNWKLVDPILYEPIQQYFIVLKPNEETVKGIDLFLNFLESEEVKFILQKYSYITV